VTAATTDLLVREWAAAIHGVCFVPLTGPERRSLVQGLAGRIAAAITAEPFDPAAGYEVGAALVAADYTAPEVLARTITVLDRWLLPRAVEVRRTALVEAVAVGFTWALRSRTLDDQEAIRVADRVARAEAERALRASEARLSYSALHDPLTGLPNQTVLMDRLAQLGGARLGICCIDLDRFEAINDSLGPPVGDRLLVAVANRLRGLAVESGHLVVRRNGDQFAILAERTAAAEDATKVADQVLTLLATPFRIASERSSEASDAAGFADGYELSITASAGVVERPVGGATPTELMQAADVALHWAKADGRDRWRLFEAARNDHDVARHRLSAEMPAAMRRGEFTLAYQPLVDLATDRLVGVEALARWRHPIHGELGADRFVDLAEDTGLIVPLGIQLLEQACRQAARWYEDPAWFVSVNLSARQLHKPGLAGEILEVLDRTGLPPAQLQLELTESAVVATDRQTLGTLAALASRGIRLVIDDFGTGYSNFAYLYDLPLHGIKLAGRLLRDVGRRHPGESGHAGQEILAALISLGYTLGLTVTAEGVETRAQAQLLRALGCRIGQGWYFGHPVSGDHASLCRV
jgi:diguanylate cyclase